MYKENTQPRVKEILQTTEYQFPKDPEKRLENILNIINTEPKILTLGFCLDRDIAKTGPSLRNDFLSLVKSSWVPTHSSFKESCNQLFLPMGMAAEEVVVYKTGNNVDVPVRRYWLTDEGLEYGRPIAAFILKYAVDHKISMYELLGSNFSRGKNRAPYNAFRILDVLRNGKLRRVDIAEAINLDEQSVCEHLKKLKKAGLVHYDSVGSEYSGWAIYKWVKGKTPGDAKIVWGDKILTKDVANLMRKLGTSECNELHKKLDNQPNPHRISRMLSGLEKQGILKRVKWRGGRFGIQSETELTDAGLKSFPDCWYKVRNAAIDGNELKHMNGILNEFDSNRDMLINYASRGMEFYKIVAPYQKGKSSAEWEAEILEIVSSYQDKNGYGPRTVEIKEDLGLSPAKHLSNLINKNKLDKKREGKKVRYFIPTTNL